MLNSKTNSMEISLKVLIMYVLIQFPISTMLKVYVPPLNLILTGLCFILFFIFYLNNKLSIREFCLLFYIVLTFFQNYLFWGFDFFNINMLFYFPFLIIYFCFFVRNTNEIWLFIKKYKRYIDAILIIWNSVVAVSFFIPNCYVFEGETKGFVSFAGTTFLLSPISIMIFSLLSIQYYLYHKKIYMFSLMIPTLCILLGNTRTYLVVLMCAWIIFIYINIKNQKYIFPLMILGVALFIVIVLLSPIKNKFINTYNRSDRIGLDPLEAFTSGRSVFWTYDIQQIFKNNPLKIIFGNGVNYLFNINRSEFSNPLWAHNDYIQILSDYGLFGLGIYIYMIYYVIKGVFGKYKVSVTIVFMVVLMWAFNAFFNMFYTYFCATLSFPFFLLLIRNDAQKRQKECNYKDSNQTIRLIG